jgi:6-phosphofructokinase 1
LGLVKCRIFGIQYGYKGLDPAFGHKPVELTSANVANITSFGGSMLGTSRSKRNTKVMTNRLEALGVDILFVIGGDGSQRGAQAIHEEMRQRGR